MTDLLDTDGMLQEWGSRLFFPKPRKAKPDGDGALPWKALSANAVRDHVRAAVAPGAHQVMVKITGGGRGMLAVTAHMRYISRQGKPEAGGRGETLELEDECGNKLRGKEDMEALRQDWRLAGSYIPDESQRREAFNIILSMPAGTPSDAVRDAARDFARETFEGHKYVFVLHEDTDSPHVHLAVRTERSDGVRLNPRKADLAVWRGRFAARLQDRGINAVATRAVTRGRGPRSQQLWRVRAVRTGRERRPTSRTEPGAKAAVARAGAIASWHQVASALATSANPDDRLLAGEVLRHVSKSFGGRLAGAPARAPSTNHRSRGGERSGADDERGR